MWEPDHKGWRLKNWCFPTVVLKEILESPLDSKEIKLVNIKWNQPWIFIGRTDDEAEAPILWVPANAESQLNRKDPDAGKDWGWEEKGSTEDEMVGWHHQFNGHSFVQTLGDSEGQGSSCAAVYGVPKSWHDWGTEQKLKILTSLISRESIPPFMMTSDPLD